MTCKELIDFLMDYTDGTLAPEERAEFDRHLNVCASCVAYLDSYKRTIELARRSSGSDDHDSVPTTIPNGLLQAILEARKQQPKV